MTAIEAIKARKSVRAYLDKDVSKDVLEKILEVAKLSPSSTNTQPWELHVVKGEAKKSLQNRMLEAFKSGAKSHMDYKYYPDKFIQPIRDRQVALGKKMYGLLGIDKENKEKSIKQWGENYTSFNAPVSIYFFIDKSLEKGSYLDSGILIQTIALTAVEMGLSTCIQGALAQYPDIVRQELNISDDKILLCGMALGYEDKNALINTFKSDRMEVEEFTKFYSWSKIPNIATFEIKI